MRKPNRDLTIAISSALPAAAVGAALGYLFDPDRGKSRRRTLIDQRLAHGRRRGRRVAARLRYRRGRLYGDLLRVVGAGVPKPTDDVDVKQQIHQSLRAAGVPLSDITIEVSNGTAVLRGQAPTRNDILRIEELTAKTPGVQTVETCLHLPGEAAPNKLDALQAGHDHS